MKSIRKNILTLLLFLAGTFSLQAADSFVTFSNTTGAMAVATNGKPLPIIIYSTEDEGVRMATDNLAADFQRVTGNKASVTALQDAAAVSANKANGEAIIVGQMSSPLIQQIVKGGKGNLSQLKEAKEKYLLQVIDNPVAGVSKAVVIAGSDKRGTIYGIYELSRQMGVSPWYWWLDVPVVHHNNIYVKKGVYTDGEPKVEYRGIFINDEWPCFGNWCKEKFGGINSKAYVHIFELLLRLKGNFMWPAMWASAFFDDDPQNGVLANKMGIVMGTSHHEPMQLNQQDWKRRGKGAWNYATNKEGLDQFWKYGIERSNNWERVVTIGMRGDGDKAMDGSGNMELMKKIITDQRSIIANVTGKPASETPQLWALYKEVQDYYDQGLRAPEDVTYLLCDDNWGNVRRLPSPSGEGQEERPGGYGMYYHFDYVGTPRNAKWINTNSLPRVWEQLNLTYQKGVRKLWIVNVGDLKLIEYPVQLFMDIAWNPDAFNANSIQPFSEQFCTSIFGERYGREAARILERQGQFAHRVTPENLNDNTYSVNYNEWQRVVAEYDQLALDADKLGSQLPKEYHDTWFELIGYPVKAMANLYDMYYAVRQNKRMAKKNDVSANDWADRATECFVKDSLLTKQFNELNGGKWNYLASQTHIGYKSWNDPKHNVMPMVTRIGDGKATGKITLPTPEYQSKAMVGENPTFVEKDGVVSIEAAHFTRSTSNRSARWAEIPMLGRTLSGITPQPVNASVDGMSLEYDFTNNSDGYAGITMRFAPTLNFYKSGLSVAVSLDGGKEQIININGDYDGSLGPIQKHQIIDKTAIFNIKKGSHTLRIRPLDNAIVLQKIMIDLGGMRKSFLGAPETLKK